MTKFFIVLAIIVVAAGGYLVFSGNHNAGLAMISPTPAMSESPAATATPMVFTDGVYALDASASSMQWSGNRPLLDKAYVDTGTITIAKGTTTVVNGQVASGSIVVDATSIHTVSTGMGAGNEMQEKDLKSKNFFNVAKYPTISFLLTRISPNASGSYTVDGTLTILGVEKRIEFMAAVTATADTLTMQATNISLDRTLWGLKYESGTYIKDLVANKVVGDIIQISFTAVGKLKQ